MRLADEGYSFLLGPNERKIYPFGQSLSGEVRRLAPGCDHFDDLGANRLNRLT
jgi:hypothetical protein